jgi:endonuclease/exonuclease/phosphatase family metal-dependent hydrolase
MEPDSTQHPSPPEPPDAVAAPTRTRPWRTVVRFGFDFVTWATVCGILLGILGQAVRDRNAVLALCLYMPLAPLGIEAVLLDALRRGRSLRPRFGLAGLGGLALVVGVVPMLGLKTPDSPPPGAAPVTLLHWNMQSGGRLAAEPRWQRAAEQILSRQPDLIVLSEAPPDAWIFHTLKRVNGGWRTVHIANDPGLLYWYKPLVCSRWPMEMEGQLPVRNGVAMSVAVRVRGSTVRLLVVDGISDPRVPRTPFLEDIAAACDAAVRAGRPYDVVVGDFNSVGRSVGFDAVRSSAGGFKRASDYSRGWRATWPVPLPVYDIDHVLVRGDAAVTGCQIFSSRTLDTDHRGQYVSFALPPEPPAATGPSQ